MSWSRFTLSTFLHSVFTLVTGQAVASAVPIIAAPVLGRLYSPHEYGLLAAYMTVAVIFGTIGNWQYSQAIIFESDDVRAWELVRVCALASLITSVCSLLAPIASMWMFSLKGELQTLGTWLWLLPLSIMMSGMTGCFGAVANRQRRFRMMSAISVATALISSAAAICLGWFNFEVGGLLGGYFTSQLVPFLIYAVAYRSDIHRTAGVSLHRLLALAIEHRRLPIYTIAGGVFRNIALGLPSLSLAFVGATDLAGHLSRATTLLALPTSLVGISLAQVFQQRAAQDIVETKTCWPIYRKTLLWLAVPTLPVFVLIAYVAPYLFSLYLGPGWRDAGYVARFLVPMMYLRMVAGPIWPLFLIYMENARELAIAGLQLFLTGAAITLAVALGSSPIWHVLAFVVANSVISLLHITETFRLARTSRPMHDAVSKYGQWYDGRRNRAIS